MENDASQRPEESGPTFVPASGSVIGGMSKDKFGRITEALQDIQLSIDGLRMQLAEANGRSAIPDHTHDLCPILLHVPAQDRAWGLR